MGVVWPTELKQIVVRKYFIKSLHTGMRKRILNLKLFGIMYSFLTQQHVVTLTSPEAVSGSPLIRCY